MTMPKVQSIPSILTDNPFATLAGIDSSIAESSSSGRSSSLSPSPYKTSATNTPRNEVPSHPIPSPQPQRKALDTRRNTTNYHKSNSGKNRNQSGSSASKKSNERFQGEGSNNDRLSDESKGKNKDKPKSKVADEGVQFQPQRQQIVDRPQDSIHSSRIIGTTDTIESAEASSQSASSHRTTQRIYSVPINENPLPINMRREWGGTTARGILEPGRPDDALDRIKSQPGVWARAGIHAEGPSQIRAATSSEWTPWLHGEAEAPTRASAYHPRLAFAQGKLKTVKNQQGTTTGKGRMTGKASGDHVWGFFQPGTTSPILVDWDKGDGRTGSMIIPAEPVSQGMQILGQSLNTDNSSARPPSFTAYTRGSGELNIFAKMGSSPLKNGRLFFEQRQEHYDAKELVRWR